ncbi:uridine kinase [Kutzneria viridogrisea]|uniref:Uridine kinase n=2 Tax=Kutzneria TaxID=43356 RepID=W5WNN5_9PSEU|nr:uridine kinase [Kutzneria albida]AHH99774.1 hypothetical protein KALB_6415 [Kutzneria albida DSM 43870]MBA8924951.1 hypothetical protein [Kutzneria viridogrisea]
MTAVRPLTPEALVEVLADRIADTAPGSRLRVLVDGAPAARPEALADGLVDPLRLRGRAVQRVSARDFLRPASLRFERGRTDPDSYYEDWVDMDGLAREVLDPLEQAGSGEVLPTLWNAETDRASRAAYVPVPEGGVVVVDGTLLLGRWLPFDLTVHLHLSPAALRRRTEPESHWTLAAHERYAEQVDPLSAADIVVRADDPRHPALVVG